MTARFLVGDVFDRLAEIEDGSVDLVVTSPPFLALRSYLPADHPDKGKEIGSEATPAEFIDVMLRVTAGLRRVLAPHGSICIELGDTYAGTQPPYGYTDEHSTVSARTKTRADGRENEIIGLTKDNVNRRVGPGWPLAKSKALIAELYRVALAYGVNPLTGQESPAGRWRVRNVVTWVRPNPPVGALGDKWRPATSDLVVACTSGKRYWDDLATRKPATTHPQRRFSPNNYRKVGAEPGSDGRGLDLEATTRAHPSGAPLLDWWEIPPGGYKGSHYAVFPDQLVVPCVQAMCPPKVCRTCGEPSRRITAPSDRYASRPNAGRDIYKWNERDDVDRDSAGMARSADNERWTAEYVTKGWSDCGHDNWRPGLILDPFAGSGTTLAVATGYGHDAIGIDLDPRNAELALERVGPFLLEVDA